MFKVMKQGMLSSVWNRVCWGCPDSVWFQFSKTTNFGLPPFANQIMCVSGDGTAPFWIILRQDICSKTELKPTAKMLPYDLTSQWFLDVSQARGKWSMCVLPLHYGAKKSVFSANRSYQRHLGENVKTVPIPKQCQITHRVPEAATVRLRVASHRG